MLIKWNKDVFEWGNRFWAEGLECIIEDHKKEGVNVWGEKGKPIREPQPFKTVRAAKKYVNSLAKKKDQPNDPTE